MGLFDRNDYGRDYGRERMRGTWNRGRGYDRGMARDRDADLTGTRWDGNPERYGQGYGATDFAWRGTEPGWSTAFNRGAHDPQWDWRAAAARGYDHDVQRGWSGGYDRGYRARAGYDRDLRARYDREPHGRMRTDAGDPFGDRRSRTPFRMLRGGFDREEMDRSGWYEGDRFNRPDPYDAGYRGWNGGIGEESAYRREEFRGWGRGRRG